MEEGSQRFETPARGKLHEFPKPDSNRSAEYPAESTTRYFDARAGTFAWNRDVSAASMVSSVSGAPAEPTEAPQAFLDLGEQERPLPATDESPTTLGPDPVDQATDLASRGEMSAALTLLRSLIAREPSNARARAGLAGLLEKRGDVEGALGELGRALERRCRRVGRGCSEVPDVQR